VLDASFEALPDISRKESLNDLEDSIDILFSISTVSTL
jgi:hypothetical protein